MVTVLRAGGLRVVIFVDDHEPAHVHVFGDGQAKINPRIPEQNCDNCEISLIWSTKRRLWLDAADVITVDHVRLHGRRV